ncbi:MAG: SDR family NAD(P)-dependent oxidoreductase [Calditrichaeota bacterium]|nr:MAG: SDR family NAD(P)-dependent oxidoreductase [Calditrichota bacterium]
MPSKAIIIGATSGIGRELAKVMSQDGHELGLTGRRMELLESLQQELPGKSHLCRMDVTDTDAARQQLDDLVREMGGVDIIVINAGVGTSSQQTWEEEARVVATNVAGFTALANRAMEMFTERGGGHIVGISSVAGLKGFGRAAAYCASKAYMSTYMQGLRHKSHRLKLNIAVTDIRPGFVATPMTEGRKDMFWLAPVDKAARQIYAAIRKRRRIAYITRRWRLMAGLLHLLPDGLFIRVP